MTTATLENSATLDTTVPMPEQRIGSPREYPSPVLADELNARQESGLGYGVSRNEAPEMPTASAKFPESSTDDSAGGTPTLPTIVDLPTREYDVVLSRATFMTSKMWEGEVLSIADESFRARLTERSVKSPEEEVAEFPISDVDPDDKELFVKGARFLFMVGYGVDRFGTQIRGSQIRFERLPNWSPDETLDAYEKVKDLKKFFNPETKSDAK